MYVRKTETQRECERETDRHRQKERERSNSRCNQRLDAAEVITRLAASHKYIYLSPRTLSNQTHTARPPADEWRRGQGSHITPSFLGHMTKHRTSPQRRQKEVEEDDLAGTETEKRIAGR